MTTVRAHILNVDQAICQNIETLAGQRGLLSQNLLAQLRNLVEGVAVFLHTNPSDVEFHYNSVEPGLIYVKSKGKLNFLGKFHKLIQKSASHYTLDGDTSERLMLKYYEYLYRTRSLLKDSYNLPILANLEKFPVDLDPSLREYHEKIAERIESSRSTYSPANSVNGRYYIHKTLPFFLSGRVYYEVTFYPAINKINKFDRIIAFTDIDISDKYAATLTLQRDSIDVFGQTMPIMVIRQWEVSIRPCEFNNFARLLGVEIQTNSKSKEYTYLMHRLTVGTGSLLDLMELTDEQYTKVREDATSGKAAPKIFPVLDKARNIIKSNKPEHNVFRYLILRMYNQIIKAQYQPDEWERRSGAMLKFKCIPFDTMPLYFSLPEHNPRYWDLVESLDITNRSDELLARRIKNNVEHNGILYTPLSELEGNGDIKTLAASYNNKLYYKHKAQCQILIDKNHAFISGYENDTVSIIQKLQEYASSGISGYTQSVERWLEDGSHKIDDPVKKIALKELFSQSRVALVYGAAGTGKSTMINHIAHYFNDKSKLFLAHTNPAIDNLKRKVTAGQDAEFRTISSQIHRSYSETYDLLVIDECSTVSNSDLIKVLENVSFRLLVLVGDIYQIESIQFGNWFSIIRSFIPETPVFELTTPYRTTNESLLDFWGKVRNIDDDIAESMASNGYSSPLNETLFQRQEEDEIILCLNYDGLYGINNINRFLQSSNPIQAVTWRTSTYKVGDPVLFYESERFRPVIYNNLKGRIEDIQRDDGWIQFDVALDRPLSEFDVTGDELEWIKDSTVRFKVYDYDTNDEDDDSSHTTVPFQIAYAVSIHKAQGLEYDSVKIVITNANEDDITHSIFYTAITRARRRLKIFWTAETQQRVLSRLHRDINTKDAHILSARWDLRLVS